MLRKIFKYWLSRNDGMYSGWDLEFINQSRYKKKKRKEMIQNMEKQVKYKVNRQAAGL